MLNISLKKFKSQYLRKKNQVIYLSLKTDGTNEIENLINNFLIKKNSFVFESIEKGFIKGRYTIFGRNPDKIWEFNDKKCKLFFNNKTKILISTPNIGFFVIRFMLLFGYFNYGKKGILDKTHTRLFTFSTFKNLIEQSDYLIKKTSGIPAPFPLAIGYNFLSKFLLKINSILIKFFKSFFSYQIYCEIKPRVSLEFLLEQAKKHVEKK